MPDVLTWWAGVLVHAIWLAPAGAAAVWLVMRVSPSAPTGERAAWAGWMPVMVGGATVFAAVAWPIRVPPGVAVALAVAWTMGALVRGALLAGALARIGRLVRGPVHPEATAIAAEMAARLGVRTSIRVVTGAVDGPSLAGWSRPVVVLPEGWSADATDTAALMAHEVAHVRRADIVLNGLHAIVRTLLWFHPAVSWLLALARQERERDCDRLAATAIGDPLAYASAILRAERRRVTSCAPADDRGLTGRIRALAGHGQPVPDAPPARAVVGLLAAMAAAALLAGGLAADGVSASPPGRMVALGALGLMLGLRHALEPDHLLAVSTFVGRERTTAAATRLGVSWGIGHTAAVVAVGVLAAALHQGLPPRLSDGFELLVAVVLLGLGARALLDGWRQGRGGAVRWHTHDGVAHAHGGAADHLHVGSVTLARRPLMVGALHGLAGSGALTAFVMASLPTAAAQVAGLLVFGAGSTLGMAALAACAGWPLARFVHRPAVGAGFSAVSGVLSMAYALVLGAPILGGWWL
ncbi:MAG: M56 family metallopeptidase [Vicinamibacterales bacterium]